MIRAAIFFACFGAFLVVGASCTASPPSDEHYFNNFKTAAAGAPHHGYTVYWLGRRFEAGGVDFVGPSVSDRALEEVGSSVGIDYYAPPARTGPHMSLSIGIFSAEEWAGTKARVLGATPPRGAVVRSAQVIGKTAELRSIPSATRPVNALVLVLDVGDTVVVATAGSGGAVTPGGPDVNPLIDEQTFLSVLQHLRPYPQ